jgi:hypothetical protein
LIDTVSIRSFWQDYQAHYFIRQWHIGFPK